MVADPPTDENQFRNLWKVYFLLLIANTLRTYGIFDKSGQTVIRVLEGAGLLPATFSLSGLIRSALDFIRQLTRLESVETGVTLDPSTSAPSGVTWKIGLREPSPQQQQAGFTSADNLLALANEALKDAGFSVWILLDRLDVAFADSSVLETNALRALFRVYRDLANLDYVSLKIFLRVDIWKAITSQGFREASHITKQITISWDPLALLNLVIRRAVHNDTLRRLYHVEEAEVLADVRLQDRLFYRIFPDQVDPGAKRPKTFDWILDRTCDGTQTTAPRELIHLLSEARAAQLRMLELGRDEPPDQRLLSGAALRDALPHVSRVRFEQTLCAEFPDLKEWLRQLEGEKTLQTPASLSKIWNVGEGEASAIAEQLVGVGFFEPRGSKAAPEYWVPFLYRSALNMVQGSAQ